MPQWPLAALAFACTTSTLPAQRTGSVETADVIFINGNIYTGVAARPRAQALAARNERILFVGSDAGTHAYRGRTTRIIDLEGNTVVPGLTDAHVHLSSAGFSERGLNLEGATSLDDLLDRVRQVVSRKKKGEWISGRGWIETSWKPPRQPTRYDLDQVAPDNPLFIVRGDGHGGVANSLALKLARIDRDTTDPKGGKILRGAEGEPVGMLVDRAQGLVQRLLPAPTIAELDAALIAGARRMEGAGWTAVQIAGASALEYDRIPKLQEEGKIKLRIYGAVSPGRRADQLMEEGARIGERGHRFTLRSIKMMIDGALGSRGAALFEPYADAEGSGLLMGSAETMMPVLEKALRSGIQIETHAIGDRANRLVLDLYEKAFNAVPVAERRVAEPRWRIEHAQIIHPDDIGRFAKLGVIASMQPSHAISDLRFAPARLGQARLQGAYAWKRLIDAGGIIAGGSDVPVEKGDPRVEFYAAVSRKDTEGRSGEGWHPELAVSREVALKMFTSWAAYAAFEEELRGTLEPGKLADMTVFSGDIMTIPEKAILDVQCVMTIVGGDVIYQKGREP